MADEAPPKVAPRPRRFVDVMAESTHKEAEQLRRLGHILLTAEMHGDWAAVAQVRSALAEAAMAAEASAQRLDEIR